MDPILGNLVETQIHGPPLIGSFWNSDEAHVEEQLERLREEWIAEQSARDDQAERKVRRDKRNAVIAGAVIGFVSTFITIEVTRRGIFWHSFLLETLFCALAGYVLVRRGADPLNGVALFGVAYLAAWLIRALGMDPSVLFAAGDIARAAMVQGNFASLCLTVSCGAGMGHVMRD